MEVFSKGVVVTVTLFPLCAETESRVMIPTLGQVTNLHHTCRKAPVSVEATETLSLAYLQDELHHLGVDQTVDRLPVDVRDEVTRAESSFLGRTVVLHVLTAVETNITD